MKQIAFVSGKGGTGKSTLVSSLSILVKDKMLADCDVDAPNLHILLNRDLLEKEDYYGAKEAVVDTSLCIKCGICKDSCRFDAITDNIEIISIKCEGCGACTLVCPFQAIELESVKTGEVYVSKTPRGIFSHALLDIGAEGSGKLVTQVRKSVHDFSNKEKWLLIDGSPGIGCVVIASITGVDAVVVVTEPTKTGLEDLKRVLGLTEHFGIPAFVCINKYDLNLQIYNEIEDYCKKNDISLIGKIPFDQSIVKALQEYKTPIEYGNKEFTDNITQIWINLTDGMERLGI
ncbi:MAG: ATP-binding protein [Mahellales bacterium]|jgi:MinD superfamily P-loop ATPase